MGSNASTVFRYTLPLWPPTAKIFPMSVAMPTPPLGVVSSATYSHLLQRGSKRSTELRGELSSKPPASNHHRVSFWHSWCRGYPRLSFSALTGSCPALSLPELYKLLKVNLTALPPVTAQASPTETLFFYSSYKDSNFIILLPELVILMDETASRLGEKQT